MNRAKLHVAVACTFIGMFAGANTASAVTVNPGETVSLPGTTAAAEPWLAGTILEDEFINFSLHATPNSSSMISGTVQQRVVRETGTGTLDFYWAIRDVTGGSLGYFRIANFGSAVFDANYRTDGMGTIGPSNIFRGGGTSGKGTGREANFGFANALGADTLPNGATSNLFFLHTDATQYAKTALFDVASTGTYTASPQFAAFAPAVPEPETYAMMLAGLGILGASTRRRKIKPQ
jgi:hypothetical protein